jgi:hypothetical protein
MQTPHLMIFCDGGIGNRINALVSGLALAGHFNLDYRIYWPENNWCQAGFFDIFQNEHPVSQLSIKGLRGTLSSAVVLLHDEIAADSLGVSFQSAYEYESPDDFYSRCMHVGDRIFFYPALIPSWIPGNDVTTELKKLRFTDHIQQQVTKFVRQNLGRPFHGLHLRRTDLNVGLSDQEVMSLVRRHPDELFFVCSDDPHSEALACAHPNVRARAKTSHVTRKYEDEEWLSKSLDDDDRSYFGNIFRGKDSVIEGVIDLLILSHSEIVGYSGSTFQKIARTLGEVSPLLSLEKPSPLNYVSAREARRRLDAKTLSCAELISLCNGLGVQGDMLEAMALLQKGWCVYDGHDSLDVLHTLGVFMLNQQQAKMAHLCLKQVVGLDSNRPASVLHLAYAELLLGNPAVAAVRLRQAQELGAGLQHPNDLQLLGFLAQQLQLTS